MDRENLQQFVKTAENRLASVRSSLLIAAQTSLDDATADLAAARRNLASLGAEAAAGDLDTIAEMAACCSIAVDRVKSDASPRHVYEALDILARIEAAVLDLPLQTPDFFSDIAALIDDSFKDTSEPDEAPDEAVSVEEAFEIDRETLEIFRSEADELLANIVNGLAMLSATPTNQNALWEIRRSVHTFKGAAGIVGLRNACAIAHRMEDLLDRLVEMRVIPEPEVIRFLELSAARLDAVLRGNQIDKTDPRLDESYARVTSGLVDAGKQPAVNVAPISVIKSTPDRVNAAATPIVRVSLERLDELIRISRSLSINRSALAESLNGDDRFRQAAVLDTNKHLVDELHAGLLRIRMIKFGTLETRLRRTVHSTCVDENKKAVLEIENAEIEVDTQMIDAFIEPLLHLLKNAVVHGIESLETRRLIGKNETGTVRVRVEADDEAVILSVIDDGGGIAVPKLKERAVAKGIIAAGKSIDDNEAVKLIFERGLTTAATIDMNAGRGVGMSIVKEAIESRGGSVHIETESQRGTKFTILMPTARSKPESPAAPAVAPRNPDSQPLVLIVDDSASIRSMTAKLAEEFGFRAITAIDGAEALELLLSSAFEPDLILSDVEMPQIDGWTLLEYVKTDKNLGHVPVVMVTSLDTDANRRRAVDLGASDYLLKPFGRQDLDKILEKFAQTV